jgi:hypothetical protein
MHPAPKNKSLVIKQGERCWSKGTGTWKGFRFARRLGVCHSLLLERPRGGMLRREDEPDEFDKGSLKECLSRYLPALPLV